MTRPAAGRCTERSRIIREEYTFLHENGCTLADIATHLGMRRESLRDIIRRQDRTAKT